MYHLSRLLAARKLSCKMNMVTAILHPKLHHSYSPADSSLLLGEGDLSYADSIKEKVDATKMVATCLDSETDVTRVYPKAGMHIRRLRKAGAKCMFGVDVHKLSSEIGISKTYNMIIFNFPEAPKPVEEGVKKQMTVSEEKSATEKATAEINRNKLLLRGIFDNSKPHLKPKGFVQIILQNSQKWDIEEIAKNCGLKVNTRTPFVQSKFKGYTPLKGDGKKPDEPLAYGNATVYQIVRPEDFNVVGSDNDENTEKKSDGGDTSASKPVKKKNKKGKSSKGKSSSKKLCSSYPELIEREATAATWKSAKTSSYNELIERGATAATRKTAKTSSYPELMERGTPAATWKTFKTAYGLDDNIKDEMIGLISSCPQSSRCSPN